MSRLDLAFWLLHPGGTYRCPLPDVKTWTLSPIAGEPGALTINYPVAGLNFAALREHHDADRDAAVAVWVDGQDAGSLRALLVAEDADDIDDAAVWRFSGHFGEVRMEDAAVEPRTAVVAPPSGDPPTEDFAAFRVYSATAGTVMATLMAEAHANTVLTDLTYGSFSNTADSNGIPWSKIITLKFAPGLSYLKVLQALVEYRLCEWEVTAGALRLYEPGTRGVDRTLGPAPVILRRGRDMVDAPRKRTIRGAPTDLIVAGGEGLYVRVFDATARARRGRRTEQYVSAGSITNEGSLLAYGQAKLAQLVHGVLEVTHGLSFEQDGPVPLLDYRVGDWVWSDTGRPELERLQVAQITLTGDDTGAYSGSVSLNDLVASRQADLTRRLDGIEGGSTITGTSQARPITDAPDLIAPAAPQGVVVESLAQPSAEAVPRAAVFASWAAVTLNADLTAIDDLAGYQVQFRYLNPDLTGNWRQPVPQVATAAADWGEVIAGEAIEVRVAALDTTGNTSAWSSSAFHTTETDPTAPPVPSGPIMTEFLGTLTLSWDGLGALGEPMPDDFDGVQIHRSTTSNFATGPGTFLETMAGPGARNYPDLPFGVIQYFRLLSYDKTGNESAPSAQGSGTPAPVGFGDIAFTNPGNLVEDGSFELPTSRATHLARSDTGWSMVTGGADHGDWFARASGPVGSGFRTLVLSPQIPTIPGEQFAFRFALRGTGVNGDVSARTRWTRSDGTVIDNLLQYTPADATGSWVAKEVPNYTAPALTEAMQVVFELHTNCTLGTWDIDRVELREMIGTLLVRNAAITDAKIATLSVGKLTAGTIFAVMIMAGLLRSAVSGLRYELDQNGLRFYDSGGNLAINLDRMTASAMLTGTVQTGLTGRRAVLSGVTNDLRFLPQVGETRVGRVHAYVPENLPNDIAVEVNASDSDTTVYFARVYVLPDVVAIAVAPKAHSSTSRAAYQVSVSDLRANVNNVSSGGVETRRAEQRIDDGGLFLETKNGVDRDGGFLWLGRGNTGAVYFGKKTATLDGYLRFDDTGAAVCVIAGNIKWRTVSDGVEVLSAVYTSRIGGYLNGRVVYKADAGGDIFFYWASGQLNIGTGSSFIKTFVIDHPLRPDRHLVHATTESPHAGVEYWGVAVVEDGEAVVELPRYFEALTRNDGRNVQVTVLAEDDPADRDRLPRRRPRTGRRGTAKLVDAATDSVVDVDLPVTPPGLPSHVQASYPRDGRFTVYASGPVDTFRVMWLVKAIRADVPALVAEPLKGQGTVHGDGPYRYYVPTT